MRLRRVEEFSKAMTKDLLRSQQAPIAHVSCGMLVAEYPHADETTRDLETAVDFAHNV